MNNRTLGVKIPDQRMLAWLYYLLLLIVAITGLFLNILGLPGLWLMVGAMACFAWATGWNHFVGWPSLITLIVLGLIGEALEFAAGAAGSKAAGGRRRGMIGGVIGALLGGIFLSFIPVPVVSTIVGACLGAFIGAAVMELTDKDFVHATRVGIGAAKGRFMGIVVKLVIGILMLVVIMIAALPVDGSHAIVLSRPTTAPATPTTAPAPATLP